MLDDNFDFSKAGSAAEAAALWWGRILAAHRTPEAEAKRFALKLQEELEQVLSPQGWGGALIGTYHYKPCNFLRDAARAAGIEPKEWPFRKHLLVYPDIVTVTETNGVVWRKPLE